MESQAVTNQGPKGPVNKGGRPRKHAEGPLKNRPTRWTDAGWADVLLIGMDRVRELVRAEAERVRHEAR